MFTVALLTTAKTWKQPKYPLADEWIKKTWYMYTMEQYSAIKEGNDVICGYTDEPREYHTK